MTSNAPGREALALARRKSRAYDKARAKADELREERDAAVIEAITLNREITRDEMASKLGITVPSIKLIIMRAIKQGRFIPKR